MSKLDYGELLCEAVDTIVTERLNGIAYDQTILCTVVDSSQKAKGIYTVSNGTVRFEAYSTDINYRVNDNVYVQIPNNNWNEQKFIIAKKTKENENEAFIYNNPFATLVDITGNIINSEIPSNESGLIANNPNKESITLWTYNMEEEAIRKQIGNPLADYTRLGIQASFQSWLNPFYIDNIAHEVVKGEYGLRLRIKATKSRKVEESETEYNYDLILNTEDMNGNPYGFESFYVQEKVFDISSLGKINSIALEFYQKTGTFTDSKGIAIPHLDFLGNSIMPNLFVKDIYICAGYDTSEFDDEMVKVYTLDSLTYSRSTEPYENNHKQIQLRWIHKQEDGTFKSITKKDDLDFTIRWYRYELGRPSADEYSDVYWKYLSFQNTEDRKSTYSIQDTDWLEYNAECPDGDERQPDFFSTWLIPDIALQTEQIKAIIIYKGRPYRSNILTCTNENEVVSRPTVDAIQALSINCEDNTYGNYRIYAEGNSLINHADASVERNFKAYFKLSGEEAHELVQARSITWMIPIENSMIELDEAYKSSNTDKGYYYEIKDGYHCITRYADDKGEIFNTQPYYIKGYYSADYGNNIVRCTIEKEKNTFYSATKELTFGVAGTTGTDTTLVLDFKNTSVSAIRADITNTTEIVANLYDANNQNVTEQALKLGCQWIWEWEELQSSNRLSIQNEDNISNICKVFNNLITNIPENEWNVLKCTLKGWGDYDLIAYLAVPLMMPYDNIQPLYIEGATNIIYTAEGKPQYYKAPYQFHYQMLNNASEPNFDDYEWSICYNSEVYNDTKVYRFLPNLNEDNALKAPNAYIKNCTNNVTVNYYKKNGNNKTILWSQPILILQNNYPSAMLNAWDGSLKIDEENNAVLASRLAAGKKNSDNTFSGVAIGDWSFGENDIQTGIYGFHTGAMSYAFKEDGTAFIGKDKKGRIHFNGDKGTIYSSNWIMQDTGGSSSSSIGMMLDLDDGIIKMQQSTNGSGIVDTMYSPISLNINTYQPNKYLYLETYLLSTATSITSGRTYYKPTSYKKVDLNNSSYQTQKYYILVDIVSEEENGNSTVTKTEYQLSTSGFNTEATYYYPSSFNKVALTSNTYEANKYYYLNSDTTPSEDDKGYFDPTVQYYTENNYETNNRYIDIDATATQFPLSIGADSSPGMRKFRVAWDGTVYIENGIFKGEIHAATGTLGDLQVTGTLTGGSISGASITGGTINGSWITANYLSANNGQIGGWTIGNNYLSGGGITLNSNTGTISGGTITGSSISASELYASKGNIGGWTIDGTKLTGGGVTLDSSGKISGGTIEASTLSSISGGIILDGYFTIKGLSTSYIGKLSSNTGTGSEAEGVGIQVGTSYIKANSASVGITYGDSSVNIQSDAVQIAGVSRPIKIESNSQVQIDSNNIVKIGCDYAVGINIGGTGSNLIISGDIIDMSSIRTIGIGQNGSKVTFQGDVDFTNAKTTGIYATLA